MYIRTALLLGAITLFGCGGNGDGGGTDTDSEQSLLALLASEAQQRNFVPLTSFAETQLSDFNFASQPDYVEERSVLVIVDEEGTTGASEFEVTKEMDADIKASLSETQLYNLNTTTSDYGYASGCLPMVCYYYMVAVYGEDAFVVDNDIDLLTFLGEIDRPVEMHLLLGTWYNARYYKEVEGGYEVLTYQSRCDGEITIEHLTVDRFGNVTFLEKLHSVQTGYVC